MSVKTAVPIIDFGVTECPIPPARPNARYTEKEMGRKGFVSYGEPSIGRFLINKS